MRKCETTKVSKYKMQKCMRKYFRNLFTTQLPTAHYKSVVLRLSGKLQNLFLIKDHVVIVLCYSLPAYTHMHSRQTCNIWFWFWQIINSPPHGVSREWGVALYCAYAADVNRTAPPWKMLWLTVPPHGTEASSSLLRFEPQKSGGMLVLKNQQHKI